MTPMTLGIFEGPQAVVGYIVHPQTGEVRVRMFDDRADFAYMMEPVLSPEAVECVRSGNLPPEGGSVQIGCAGFAGLNSSIWRPWNAHVQH